MTIDRVTEPEPTRRGWLRKLLLLALVLLAFPYVLSLVYRFVPPPVSMLMLIRSAGGEAMDYRWTPIDKISTHLVNAVASAEDARICEHGGVDWDVLQGLVKDALDDDNEPARGGSTIAMQTAKNLYLWPQRSYLRKGLEVPISLWIGLVWPERRTVEIYLNIAEWAPGIYGAEAAAQHHFNRSAADLTRRQAIALAAALPNPHLFNPGKPGPKLRRRARRLAKRVPRAPAYLKCLHE